MADYFPNDKAEEALVSILTDPVAAVNASASVVAGKYAGDKAAPIVICSADGSGEEDPQGTGNFWLDCKVEVKTIAVNNQDGTNDTDDAKATNQALVSAVFQNVIVDELATLMTAAVTDFTVFDNSVTFSAPTRDQDEAGVWVDTLPFKIYCCATDLAS